MRIVVALGGNALLMRGEKPDAEIQRHHIQRAAAALAPLADEHDLIVCHGNGPQVGLLAVESEADRQLTHPYPLDVLVAQTQGMIGYWLAQELRNAGVRRPVAALVTQTLVHGDDPGFDRPTKLIGATLTRQRAHVLAARHGWTVAPDGPAWRRVVASPRPVGLVEEETLRALADSHAVVVCGGGGGAPVVAVDGGLQGVEAVVDKDHVAALIATRLAADRLLILTDVPAVMRDYGTPRQEPIRHTTTRELAGMSFPAGSMGPKVAACIAFTTATGKPSAIGRLDDAAAVLHGSSGTTIVRAGHSARPEGMSGHGAVLVGVDGSKVASAALEFAADEAHRRGARLVIAHAVAQLSAEGNAVAELVRDDALTNVTSRYADLDCEVVQREGEPTALLEELSRATDLLVVGTHRTGRLRGWVLGAVSQYVAAHAACPVVTISGSPEHADRPIVLGASASPGGMAALRFACTEAQLRGVPVHAVRSVTTEEWALSNPGVAALVGAQVLHDAAQAELDRLLATADESYPDVQITGDVASRDPFSALLHASADASLLVIGSRRSRTSPLPHLGPVAAWLLHQATCPLAVVGYQSE